MKKVATEDLRPGMYVVDAGLSWVDYPLLYQGEGVVADQAAVDAILEEGYREAFIDPSRSAYEGLEDELPVNAEVFAAAAQGGLTAPKAASYQQELVESKRIYSESLKFIRTFMEGARLGALLDYTRAEGVVESMLDSIMRNEDAMLSMIKLRNFDEYTYTHSLNTAVIALAFGRRLGMPRESLLALGLSAMHHDVGKARIPSKILNKPGKLSDEEFAVMKSHPVFGCELLTNGHTVPEPVLRGVLEHHEKHNGSGYPHSVAGPGISSFARVIAVADVYDALTSDRVYRRGMLPHKALSIIYSMRGEDFAPGYAEQFIKSLGIYPVGSFVRLTSRDYGFVAANNPEKPLSPVVRVVFDGMMRPRPPRDVDLADAEAQGRALQVSECLDARDYKVDAAVHLA